MEIGVYCVLMEIGAYSRPLLWRGVWGRLRLHRGMGALVPPFKDPGAHLQRLPLRYGATRG